MKGISNSEKRHNAEVVNLEQRLLDTNQYEWIHKFIEIKENGRIKAEMDIEGKRRSGRYVVYEVKGHDNARGYKRGKNQLANIKFLRPHRNYITVYHSPERTKRVY